MVKRLRQGDEIYHKEEVREIERLSPTEKQAQVNRDFTNGLPKFIELQKGIAELKKSLGRA